MSVTYWHDDRHRCWVLEYRYLIEDSEVDEFHNDQRIAWMASEIDKSWPNATRMSYDQWYWYDKEEMQKFLTVYHLNFN